jgi:hypothetical protein
MIRLALVLLALVPAGSGFGEATATGTVLGADEMRVELQIEIAGAGSVVAHLIEPGEEQQTVSLRDRGGGEFGGFIETRRVDLVVVFETLGDDPRQSEPLRFSQLGVSRTALGMDPPLAQVVDSEGDDNSQWGWLGLGLGAAALSMVAIWALGADSKHPDKGLADDRSPDVNDESAPDESAAWDG